MRRVIFLNNSWMKNVEKRAFFVKTRGGYDRYKKSEDRLGAMMLLYI